MNKLDQFKEFIKTKPFLVTKVKNNEVTWQQLYEIYDIYGENNEIFDEQKKEKEAPKEKESPTEAISGVLKIIQNIDIDKINSSLDSIRSVLKLLGEFNNKSNKEEPAPTKSKTYRRYYD